MQRQAKQAPEDKGKKEIIGILMESALYFELSLEERELLINKILAS